MLAKSEISPGGWAGGSVVLYSERRLMPGSSQGLPAGEEVEWRGRGGDRRGKEGGRENHGNRIESGE